MKILNAYLSEKQRKEIEFYTKRQDPCEYFLDKIAELTIIIEELEKAGFDNGKSINEHTAQIHYTLNQSEWFIFEIGSGPDKGLAGAFACINQWADMAEIGVVSISDLTGIGAKLDLDWQPTPLHETMKRIKK